MYSEMYEINSTFRFKAYFGPIKEVYYAYSRGQSNAYKF